MMRGTKRFAASDFNPSPDDSILSKRVLVGSSLDMQRAEPLQQQLVAASPPLDSQRAESSRQHVRALNTQFASWIQIQLEMHPDELWEDGVQDYLNHSKTIMDKFSDVISWLKSNAAKTENNSITDLDAAQKKFGSEINQKDSNLFGKPGIPPASTTTSFSTSSWGSGALFNNSSPFSFGLQNSVSGSQNSVSINHDGSNNLDGEDNEEQPSSPSVKRTEEEGVIVVHEVNCRLYVKVMQDSAGMKYTKKFWNELLLDTDMSSFSSIKLLYFIGISAKEIVQALARHFQSTYQTTEPSDPTGKDAWKDKGSGQLSIKCKEGVGKGTKESKPIIVVRNDVGKVLLNASLYTGIKTILQKKSVIAIFHTSGDGDKSDTVVAQTFLIRTRSEEERDKLAETIKEYAPAA